MIIRAPKDKDNPYFLGSSAYANDSRLSWAARGMMTYLIDKPDNWKIIVEDLINKSPAGKHATRATLNELIQYGYVVRHQKRDPETHQWCEVYYTVCENPATTPLSDFPQAGEPEAEKPSTEDQPLSNTKSEQKLKESVTNSDLDLITFIFPEDLKFLQRFVKHFGSAKSYISSLRAQVNRLGADVVENKIDEYITTHGAIYWKYVEKSLSTVEVEKPAHNVVQVDESNPEQYAGMTWDEFCKATGEDFNMPQFRYLALVEKYGLKQPEPIGDEIPLYELLRQQYQLERFGDDDYGETIDLNATMQLPVSVSPEIQQAFERAKHQLSLQFDTSTYMYFMRDMTLTHYCPESYTITIEAPSERTQQYTRNIRRVISDALNQTVELVFTSGSREARLPTYEGLKTGQVAACPA